MSRFRRWAGVVIIIDVIAAVHWRVCGDLARNCASDCSLTSRTPADEVRINSDRGLRSRVITSAADSVNRHFRRGVGAHAILIGRVSVVVDRVGVWPFLAALAATVALTGVTISAYHRR